MKKQVSINHKGESLLLDYRKCVFWSSRNMLILSDTHFGKESVFQRRGMAIPGGIAETGIAKLQSLIEEYSPSEVLVLGDLVHTLPQSDEHWLGTFAELEAYAREKFNTRFTVVLGNHDKAGTASRLPLSITWQNDLTLGPFTFTHEPPDSSSAHTSPTGTLTLCGHLHPCLVLGERKGSSLRMPVFWLTASHLVLPAFGEFTGMMKIDPGPTERTFAVGPDGIVESTVAHKARSQHQL